VKTRRTYEQWRADAAAILGGLALLLPSFFVLAQMQQISANREVAMGIVHNKTVDEGGEGAVLYYLNYSFKDGSGREYRGSGSVGISLYKRVAPGDSLPVEYAADHPETSQIAGAFNPQMIEVVAFAASGIILFFYLGPRRWLRTWRGEPDPGPLT
jgi:hypothetical protein